MKYGYILFLQLNTKQMLIYQRRVFSKTIKKKYIAVFIEVINVFLAK